MLLFWLMFDIIWYVFWAKMIIVIYGLRLNLWAEMNVVRSVG